MKVLTISSSGFPFTKSRNVSGILLCWVWSLQRRSFRCSPRCLREMCPAVRKLRGGFRMNGFFSNASFSLTSTSCNTRIISGDRGRSILESDGKWKSRWQFNVWSRDWRFRGFLIFSTSSDFIRWTTEDENRLFLMRRSLCSRSSSSPQEMSSVEKPSPRPRVSLCVTVKGRIVSGREVASRRV